MNKTEFLESVKESKKKFQEHLESHKPEIEKEASFQMLLDRATQGFIAPLYQDFTPDTRAKLSRIFCKNTLKTYLDSLELVLPNMSDEQLLGAEKSYNQLESILKEWI